MAGDWSAGVEAEESGSGSQEDWCVGEGVFILRGFLRASRRCSVSVLWCLAGVWGCMAGVWRSGGWGQVSQSAFSMTF